jgi:hypothetical protein
MRNSMIFAKSVSLFLLLVLAMSAVQARAQNQTPANVGPVAGVWTDPATGLTWTKADNGSDVNWNQANAYCSNLRLGGYSDWRLPTIDELQDIYDPGIDIPGHKTNGEAVTLHVKGNLRLSSTAEWSSSQDLASGRAWDFYFDDGTRMKVLYAQWNGWRTLCVRR